MPICSWRKVAYIQNSLQLDTDLCQVENQYNDVYVQKVLIILRKLFKQTHQRKQENKTNNQTKM